MWLSFTTLIGVHNLLIGIEMISMYRINGPHISIMIDIKQSAESFSVDSHSWLMRGSSQGKRACNGNIN